jgi:hypothetical protein
MKTIHQSINSNSDITNQVQVVQDKNFRKSNKRVQGSSPLKGIKIENTTFFSKGESKGH